MDFGELMSEEEFDEVDATALTASTPTPAVSPHKRKSPPCPSKAEKPHQAKAPKAKASKVTANARGKRGGGSYAKAGKATKQCRGCERYFPIDFFQINSPYCPDDEAALKRIGRLCKAQGVSSTWLGQLRRDPSRVHRLLRKYYQKCPPQQMADGKKKVRPRGKGGFSLTEYMEYEKAEHVVSKKNAGPMMHEARYLMYAVNVLGYTPKRAQEKWEEMQSNPSHPFRSRRPRTQQTAVAHWRRL